VITWKGPKEKPAFSYLVLPAATWKKGGKSQFKAILILAPLLNFFLPSNFCRRHFLRKNVLQICTHFLLMFLCIYDIYLSSEIYFCNF